MMTASNFVQIFDTTLRDGEQSPGATMNVEDKLIIARQLEKLGVDVIEAGFAAASDGDAEAVRGVADVVATPIVLSLARTRQGDLEAALETWRSDWESGETDRYLAHYSQRFHAGEQDYRAWAAHKRRVNSAKQWIRVGIANSAMFRYPRERDFVIVAFDQDYRSSNLSNSMRKVQYWVLENGYWKILYEGAA